jgi:hypothetical protein
MFLLAILELQNDGDLGEKLNVGHNVRFEQVFFTSYQECAHWSLVRTKRSMQHNMPCLPP